MPRPQRVLLLHPHRQPENILYNENWVLKVADFGVSINLNDERAVTRAGTVDYMVSRGAFIYFIRSLLVIAADLLAICIGLLLVHITS